MYVLPCLQYISVWYICIHVLYSYTTVTPMPRCHKGMPSAGPATTVPGCMSDSLWQLAVHLPEKTLSHRACPWGGHLVRFDSRPGHGKAENGAPKFWGRRHGKRINLGHVVGRTVGFYSNILK